MLILKFSYSCVKIPSGQSDVVSSVLLIFEDANGVQ